MEKRIFRYLSFLPEELEQQMTKVTGSSR